MVRLRAVGECCIEIDGGRIGPEAERAFALLLVLTLANGRPVGRHQLIDLLWPATSEERARHNLRQTLYKLRQLGVAVTTESTHLRLDDDQIAPHLLLQADPEGPPPRELLRPDVAFGDFLSGYLPTFSAPFRAWVEEQRSVMHARMRRVALHVLFDERRRGNWGAVETIARKVLQLDPFNEEATLNLAEATALTGSKRAALGILDTFLAELGEEGRDIRLPAVVLRRRIAERVPSTGGSRASEGRFVGREESIELLNAQFAIVRQGAGRSVLVWGEAGIGKTRLLSEFSRFAALAGAQTLTVACHERDVERPLSLFVDLVPLLLGLPGALGCAPESMEYLRRLTAHDPAVLEPYDAAHDPEFVFAGLRRAIYDLVDAVSSEAPLVLCCEDLHWLDAQSWRVLRELAGTTEARPVLLLMSSRLPHATPEPPTRGAPGTIVHRLAALDHTSALALFLSLTEEAQAPRSFRDWSIAICLGNPLALHLATSHWLQTRDPRAPASVKKLIADRLQRLGLMNQRVLRLCAVLGRNARYEFLASMLGTDHRRLLAALEFLAGEALIVSQRGSTPCRHELIAEIALDELAEPARRALHASAANVLEQAISSSAESSLPWAAAEQWVLAGDDSRALQLVRTCGAHLLRIGLAREATELYSNALSMCRSDHESAEMLVRLADCARRAGQWPIVVDACDRAFTLPQAVEATLPVDLRLLSIEARWRTGCPMPALLKQAVDRVSDGSMLAVDRARAGVLALIFADNLCDAFAANQAFVGLAPLRTPRLSRLLRKQFLDADLIYHSSYGQLDAAVLAARTLIDDATDDEDEAERLRSMVRASIPLRRAGFYDEAVLLVREALKRAEDNRLASAACSAADSLSTILLESGDLQGAVVCYHRALQWLGRQDGIAATNSIQLLGARLALAQQQASEASELLREHQNPSLLTSLRHRIEVGALLLDLALQQGDPISVDHVKGLHDQHVIAKSHGGQDYATRVLVDALVLIGDVAEGGRIAEAYLTMHRRERSVVPADLAAACERVRKTAR